MQENKPDSIRKMIFHDKIKKKRLDSMNGIKVTSLKEFNAFKVPVEPFYKPISMLVSHLSSNNNLTDDK